MNSLEKLERLKAILINLDGLAIAFSGGVDSSFLLKVAHEVLGEKVIAVTARSCSFPERELNEAVGFARKYGIKHLIVDSEELDIEGFAENPRNRCYMCKKELFSKIITIADEYQLMNIAEGSNLDDLGDYRPGMQAIEELGVLSPLREASLTKEEIRELSLRLGLKTWDKPSFACLASRFPYGEKITLEKLVMVDRAEQYLLDKGIRQVRVRHHGDVARIETGEDGWEKLMKPDLRTEVYAEFRTIGFVYVALDLIGYRTGSMNESMASESR
ncbi:Conserved hypothetical protein CHP00268 [Syntrophobotulus glycolicus DSM 8271]|uniref:NAD/GMP synthase domain-containing protein n=1 Tax=Syntrophobotulus glycolicus (strain DSM 8271 / FlGlyR) TaxID=645991 RepID=F0SUT9_SYNGF|nr:ATP-dependent sacrificial sulfur transferase LarE [Syntrophobotulus glycolicus]ADY56655.1 Conserved hypothetical protein CHP00268 [Syntrophobotulus glycolicus DSM 8271]